MGSSSNLSTRLLQPVARAPSSRSLCTLGLSLPLFPPSARTPHKPRNLAVQDNHIADKVCALVVLAARQLASTSRRRGQSERSDPIVSTREGSPASLYILLRYYISTAPADPAGYSAPTPFFTPRAPPPPLLSSGRRCLPTPLDVNIRDER